MSIDLEVTPEKGFLRVRVTGRVSLRDANDAFARMLVAVARQKAAKVLVDCRDVKGTMTTADRYQHASFGAEELSKWTRMGESRGTRLAYVAKPPSLDRRRFGETVAVNRGVNVKAFDNTEEALRWLEIDPAGQTMGDDRQSPDGLPAAQVEIL
jgi:hypothetical protein